MRFRRAALAGVLGMVLGVAFGVLVAIGVERALTEAASHNALALTSEEGIQSAGLSESAASEEDSQDLPGVAAEGVGGLGQTPAATRVAILTGAEVASAYEPSVVIVSTFVCGLGGRSSAVVLSDGRLLMPNPGWHQGAPWWVSASTGSKSTTASQWESAGPEFGMVTADNRIGTPLGRHHMQLDRSGRTVSAGDDAWVVALLRPLEHEVATSRATVTGVTDGEITVGLDTPAQPSAVGGILVDRWGGALGVVAGINAAGDLRVVDIPSGASRVSMKPSECHPDNGAVVQQLEASSASRIEDREIASLLRLQHGESLLAAGNYGAAREVDSFVATLSSSALSRGWDVTKDSFVVPVRVISSSRTSITWSLGLVTHETNHTSKRFCVQRTVDLVTWTVHRDAGASVQVGGEMQGWVDPESAGRELQWLC